MLNHAGRMADRVSTCAKVSGIHLQDQEICFNFFIKKSFHLFFIKQRTPATSAPAGKAFSWPTICGPVWTSMNVMCPRSCTAVRSARTRCPAIYASVEKATSCCPTATTAGRSTNSRCGCSTRTASTSDGWYRRTSLVLTICT